MWVTYKTRRELPEWQQLVAKLGASDSQVNIFD